jgi:methyl-accepting chemotaxis protein
MTGLKLGGKLFWFLMLAVITPIAVHMVDVFNLPIWISPIFYGIAFIALIAIYLSVKKSVEAYKHQASEAVGKLSKGGFNLEISAEEKDELIVALFNLSEGLKKFTDEISQTAKKQAAGTLTALSDEKSFDGGFREAVKNINASYVSNSKDLDAIAESLRALTAGEMRVGSSLTGEKAKVSTGLDALLNKIRALTNEIQSTSQAVSEGRLSYRADTGNYSGEWSKAAGFLNDIPPAVSSPVNELKSLLERFKRGDIGSVSNRSFKGEYSELFQSLDQLGAVITSHNKELLAVLDEIARYTPGRSTRREYTGVFPAFKTAVGDACGNLEKLNNLQEKPKPAATGFITGKPQVTVSKAAAKPDSFISAQPNLGHRTVIAPSAAKVYDAKDFGKY